MKRFVTMWILAGALAACGPGVDASDGGAGGGTQDAGAGGGVGGAGGAGGSVDGGADGGMGTDGGTGTDGGSGDGGEPCLLGTPCNPIVIDALPYTHSADTTSAPGPAWDTYGCAPTIDESGGAFVYELTTTSPGMLRAFVDDVSGDGIDVDVHILSGLDPTACLDRANIDARAFVGIGTWYIVVDTWVDGSGTAYPGAYQLTVELMGLPGGDCTMTAEDLRMFWTACAPGIDCYTSGGEYYLRLPAIGPVVKEAHLVTVAETFTGGWPTSFTDGIANHYTVSENATGYVMTRSEPWAPAGEGGSEYGQGSTGAPLPVLDEAWYVNMYWKDRPAKGTRMILWNPVNGKAVVASAGYETGPGANTSIGGVTEEIHDHLGTGHRDDLVMGFAADQTLPLGPLVCP